MASSVPAAVTSRSNRVAAFEEQAVRQATRALDAKLGEIADTIRVNAAKWAADPAEAMRGRRAVAAQLRALRPQVAATVRPLISRGVSVGAAGKTVTVDPLADDLVKQVMREADAKVRAKARAAAATLTSRKSLRTAVQARNLADRVMAVGSPAEAAASTVAVRTVDLAGAAAAGDTPRVWVTHGGCCAHCAGFSGSVARPGGMFHPRLKIADHPLPWVSGGVKGPPLHDGCTCVAVRESTGLADALAKATAREVATGKTGYLSAPAKARAAKRLLRARAPLTPDARKKATRLARTA